MLRIFYDEAKIFVFPSLYEGFGLPPLEAMVHGTPVVTSNVSSLPEVVGNAAVLVNPENVFEIMRALHRVLMDQALRERMKERGYQQAKKFSWEKSVRRILDAYHEIADEGASQAARRSANESTPSSYSTTRRGGRIARPSEAKRASLAMRPARTPRTNASGAT